MAIETVPPGDERCDVCAGNRDRPKPRPGERWSVREKVHTMCEDCYRDSEAEMHTGLLKVVVDTPMPDDPSQN